MAGIRQRSGANKNDTVEVIKALIEFSRAQRTPIEKTINEFLPYINSSNSSRDIYEEIEKKISKIEATVIIHQEFITNNSEKSDLHEVDKRLTLTENNLKNLQNDFAESNNKTFWKNVALAASLIIITILLTIIYFKQSK